LDREDYRPEPDVLVMDAADSGHFVERAVRNVPVQIVSDTDNAVVPGRVKER